MRRLLSKVRTPHLWQYYDITLERECKVCGCVQVYHSWPKERHKNYWEVIRTGRKLHSLKHLGHFLRQLLSD